MYIYSKCYTIQGTEYLLNEGKAIKRMKCFVLCIYNMLNRVLLFT